MSEPVGNTPRSSIPGNPHKQREAQMAPEQPEKIEKIVQGKVVARKPNVFKRVARGMVADDVTNVGDFVVAEVFLPALRNLVYDIISQGSHKILFGTSRGRRTGAVGRGDGPVSSLKTAYHRIGYEDRESREMSASSRARHDFEDLIVEDYGEAIDVLESLVARLDRYKTVSVADLYDYLGVSGAWTDREWGWTDLDGSKVRQVRGGYTFDLPRPSALR